MDCLYQKREELRATIAKARDDLKAIEAAIRVFEGTPKKRPDKLFARGHLMALVCNAMRAGHESNRDIARYVVEQMEWEPTQERLSDITRRVKDVTKRLKHDPRFAALSG